MSRPVSVRIPCVEPGWIYMNVVYGKFNGTGLLTVFGAGLQGQV